MWVFLISRTLQPILILLSDKEIKIKARQLIGSGDTLKPCALVTHEKYGASDT
jgi:hypothetical protein